MRGVAEDVYYVPRDGGTAIGLNQLLEVPGHLTEVELEAISGMCGRSSVTMSYRNSIPPMPAWRAGGSMGRLPHGLYYVGPDGSVWLISQPDSRPDLDGSAMDFAVATVRMGQENLDRLRRDRQRSA